MENRHAEWLLEELESHRAMHQTLSRHADGEPVRATVHSAYAEAYSNAMRAVARALPKIIAEALEEEPVVGTPVMDLRLDEPENDTLTPDIGDMAPGELVEAWGK